MSPSRYSSLILALAPALCGQPLASIDITAPRSWLLSARTMRLDARAATPLGLPVPNFAPAWRSLNPAVATIDSSGLVRGLAPGVASIEATAGGVTGRFKLEVYPGRIEITPRRVELRAGETMDLAAGAYDADGKVIPGVRFTWISSLANIAAVSPSGQLRAAAEGSTSITARVDAGAPEYNAEAQAAVIVRRRPDYQLAALAANDTEAGPVTYRYGSVASFAGDWITLWAGISSGAQALLLAGPGGTQALAVSGQFLDQAGRVLAGVRETSVNTRGDVAARLYFFPANCDVVFLFRNGGAEPIMRDCGAVLTPRSISDAGDVLFLLNGQLFLRRSDGSRELIARIGLDVPEFGVVTNFGDRQLWPSGQVIFELLNAQGQRGSFTWEGGQIRKLYARGETYDGGLINNGIVPVPSQSGDFYAVIQNTRTTQIARNSSGAWSNVLTSGQTYGSVRLDFIYVSFLDVSADGSLVFLGRTQQGDALLRRQGQTLEILARYGANVDWRSFSQAFFTSQGVVASGAPRDALYRLYRFGEGGGPILQTGQAVEFPAPAGILWSGLLNTVSGPVFRTYIDSLARPGAEGVLSQGDTLPDGSTFTGVQGAAFDTNLNGDIAFVSNRLLLAAALYVWRGGTVSLVAAPNGSVRGSGDRVISNVFYPVSLNTRGQFVSGATVGGVNELLLFTAGSPVAQTVFAIGRPAPGGGNFAGFREAALDDNGRVLFQANISGGPTAVFLWENGELKQLARTGEANDRGLTFALMRFPQAAGDRFYALLRWNPGQGSEIAEYRDGWRTVVRTGVRSTLGPVVNSFVSERFVVNAAGDIAFLPALSNGTGVMVRKSDGNDLLVAHTAERSPDGAWFGNFYDLSFTPDGSLFFTAISPAASSDRLVVYQASPQ